MIFHYVCPVCLLTVQCRRKHRSRCLLWVLKSFGTGPSVRGYEPRTCPGALKHSAFSQTTSLHSSEVHSFNKVFMAPGRLKCGVTVGMRNTRLSSSLPTPLPPLPSPPPPPPTAPLLHPQPYSSTHSPTPPPTAPLLHPQPHSSTHSPSPPPSPSGSP